MRTSGLQFGLTLVLAAVCLATAVRVPASTRRDSPLVKPTQETENLKDVDFACSLCLFLSADANKNLHKPASYANFKNWVETRICDNLPLVTKFLCKKVAPKLLPDVYHFAEKELAEGKLCSSLCKGSDTVNSTCGICEYGCDQINTFLAKPDSDVKALHFAENVCPLFAPSFQPTCVSDIEKYGPEVLGFIQQVTSDPRDTCNKLKFCIPDNTTAVASA